MPFTPFPMMRSTKKEIELETVLANLNLRTVDETQTAFAKNGIHISETTAFRWREMAKENPVPQLWDPTSKKINEQDSGQNPTCCSPPDAKTHCFKRLKNACTLMFGK